MNFFHHMLMWGRVALLALILNGKAQATDVVVSPPNCNEAGFNNALTVVNTSGSGAITFSCGSTPVTITFTQYKAIGGDVVIDGANLITFDGNEASAFFQVSGGKTLTLQRLTLQRGVFHDVHALEVFGNLNLSGVTMQNNVSTDSVIQHNGGAIINSGSLLITASTFIGNAINGASGSKGAVLDNLGGAVRIVGSTFRNNGFSPANSGSGGAIENDAGGDLHVYSSTFAGNHALDGGAIDNHFGTTNISDSIFTDNVAGYGGAIESFGDELDVSNTRFTGNTATDSDGGAIWNVQGMLEIDRSEFVGNRQTSAGTTGGGAISCYDDALVVTNSAFATNATQGHGGAIYSTCGMSVTNSTFNANAANTTSGGGGAIAQLGPKSATVEYATIAGNAASFGGVYADGAGGGLLILAKTILAANTGGNCAGVLATAGYNLSNDTSCGGFFDPALYFDLSNANLPLGIYQDNGGGTSTLLPEPGNQAIDRIPSAQCLFAYDQRGAVRPAGGACDSGAVELDGVIDVIFADGFDSR